MNKVLRISLLTVSLAGLSGCQSFPLTSWMFKRPSPSVAVAPESDGARALAEGRAALAENRPAAAVMPLRIAMLDPAMRAQASNALGVAYAQMGREDLAERFFKTAIAADPADTRFSDNLMRLQTVVLARKAKAHEARLAQQSISPNSDHGAFVIPAAPTGAQDSAASRTAGIAERRSRSEVFIPSAGQSSAPTATVAFASPSKAAKSALPKSVEVADPSPIKVRVVSSPIRIRFADVPAKKPPQPAGAGGKRP